MSRIMRRFSLGAEVRNIMNDDGKNSYEVAEDVFVMGRECNPWNLRRFLSSVIASLCVAAS